MCLKILIRESLFYVNLECFDRNTTSNSPRALLHKIKILERKGPSLSIIPKCASHERNPCAPEFEEISHEETLIEERCARKAAWDLAKNNYKLMNSDTTMFYVPGEAKVMSTPIA